MKIKKYLQIKGIRQIEIAKYLNAPMSVINPYVNEWKPLPKKHLKNLAEFLGVSIDELKRGEITKLKNLTDQFFQ